MSARRCRPTEDKLKLQKKDQLLSFVYGSHKAENGWSWTPRKARRPTDLLKTNPRKSSLAPRINAQGRNAHKVDFNFSENHESKSGRAAQSVVAR